METNAKIFALRETITNAIKDDCLEKRLDVLKLQAEEIGIGESALKKMIDEQRSQVNKQNKVLQIVQGKKSLFSTLCLIAVAIEWGIGLWIALSPKTVEVVNENVVKSSFHFSTIIWLLLANVLTILIIVFVVAYILNKRVKN